MIKNTNKVVYSSDLIIRDSTELATLCVFFDKVLLPYTTESTSRKFTGPRIVGAELPRGLNEDFAKLYIDDVNYWWQRNKVLFEEQVIERLPQWQHIPSEDFLFKIGHSERIEALTKASVRVARIQMTMSNEPFGEETPEEDLKRGVMQEILIKQDLLLHVLRPDLKLPQLLVSDAKRLPREYLKAIEAKVTFSYLLPTLSSLTPDEILEVRKKVKDNREGFSMLLQDLSKDIDNRLKGGESAEEILSFAESVIDTKLMPFYYEFKRQLTAEKTASGKKVLDFLGKVSGIDVGPSTPKFWIELLKALGLVIPSASEQKERLSNKTQAFQFMRAIEDISK
jgi:hypothetical protein